MSPTRLAAAVGLSSLTALTALAGWSAAETGARVPALETRADQQVYQVDAVHSSLVFKIRHANLTNFYGRFNDLAGEIHFDPENPEASRFAFTVKTDSVDTGNTNRDNHLKNADFFNSRQFPEITFVSTAFKKTADGAYELTGDLTLQGETRPVTALLTGLTTGKTREADALGFEAAFTIKRSDFGMNKYLAPDNGDGGALGNTVSLTVSVEAAAG